MSALTELLKPDQTKEIVAFLRDLSARKSDGPAWMRGGICSRLSHVISGYDFRSTASDDVLHNIMARARFWPPYSGNPVYPVPSTRYRSLAKAYDRLRHWGPTKYGDLRRSLCAFLADHIEKYPDFDPEREAPTREAAE